MWDDEQAEAIYEVNTESWSIVSELLASITNWQHYIREYWALDSEKPPEDVPFESWEKLKRWSRLVEPMFLGVTTLVVSSKKTEPTVGQKKEVRRALQDFGRIYVLSQLVELKIVAGVIESSKGASERAIRLLGQVQTDSLSRTAADYLRRACGLYLAGYGPEVAVMCRGGLEAVLTDELLASGLLTTSQRMSLEDKIDCARDNGILSSSSPTRGQRLRDTPVGLAHEIRKAGNYVVHDQPGFKPRDDGLGDPFEAIRALSRVLDNVFRENREPN
ncbi:MAG: hypothetical protein R3B35_12345 [Gemmatimonadales bacterium]